MEKPRRVIREHKWFVIIGTTNVIIMYTVGVQYGGTVSGGGVTSTHNEWGCAILTKKVAPQNPGTYLKLRPKNSGTLNVRLSFYMRKLTTQIRKSLISTPRFSFTYFIKGFYCFMMFVHRVLNFPQTLSV